MKKVIISSLVGAIIVFMYQSLSWMVMPTHKYSFKGVTNQVEVLNTLTANMPEEGVYSLPYHDMENSDKASMEKDEAEWGGKPWAMVSYHKAWNTSMGLPMGRGLLIDFLGVMMVALVISKSSATSFGGRFNIAMYMTGFVLCIGVLMDWNWWSTPWHYVSGVITDVVISGILTGIWMGWYWGRGV